MSGIDRVKEMAGIKADIPIALGVHESQRIAETIAEEDHVADEPD